MTPPPLLSTLDLRRFPPQGHCPPWRLDLRKRELNGGKTTVADLAAIDEHPQAVDLVISGLDQASFEALVTRYGQRFRGIYFFKCPRVADLSALSTLDRVTHLAFFWNQKATRLWDFRGTASLRGLHFDDFKRMNDLSQLADARSLEDLCFGTAAVDTLEPLGALQALRSLRFATGSVGDGRIEPLARMTGLQELGLNTHLFTTEQLAWLRARLPTVRSEPLDGFQRLLNPYEKGGKKMDVLACGKGKPVLSSAGDAPKIARLKADFDALVRDFANDP
ncbi:MAG TPA: hypothetical protein VIP05_30475, partial [Burkholderiaceae bacterium]